RTITCYSRRKNRGVEMPLSSRARRESPRDAAERARVRELPTSTVRGNCRRSVCDGGFPTPPTLRSPARNHSRSHDDTRAIHPLAPSDGRYEGRNSFDRFYTSSPCDSLGFDLAIIAYLTRLQSRLRDMNSIREGRAHDTSAWRNRHGRLKVVDFNEQKVN
ncbi:hypothetical protein ALC62_06119, partial [Cyphomyrmex costatus]